MRTVDGGSTEMNLEPVEKRNPVLAKGWRPMTGKGERITKSGPWAPVTSFPSVYEADAAVSVLSAAGIAAKIERPASVGILRSGFGGRAGSVTVLVPLTRLSEAQAILRGPRDHQPSSGSAQAVVEAH